MREALSYPTRGENAETALLSAWICVFAHTVAVPLLALVPLVGYVASVIGDGGERPPPFLDRAILVRGVGSSVLVVVYATLPLAVGLVTFRLLAETGQEPTGGEPLLILAGSTTVLFFLAAGSYLLPIALGNYVREGSLRAGFGGLARVGTRATYFVGWCVAIVFVVSAIGVGTALIDLGGLGAVVGTLVVAYGTIAGSRRIGRAYADVTG